MATLLIYGIPKDFHAEAVRWGLEAFGVKTCLWVAGDLPDYANLSVSIDATGTEVIARNRAGLQRLDDVQLIWNRRNQLPQAPEFAAATDRTFIEQQCQEHASGMRQLLSRKVPTVHSKVVQSVAARKTVQIDHARQVGFKIPATLISNDYASIHRFWSQHAPLIVKPFKTTAWLKDDLVFAAYTAIMPEPSAEHRAELEICPQIFQSLVSNKRDVRLITFGSHCFAAELDGATHRSVVDVRDAIRSFAVKYRPIAVPGDIQRKVAAYLEALGLQYGAFDFAIDEAGEWVFLECNEAGQFLFLEVALPEMPLLDAFCRWFCDLMGVDTGARPEPLRLSDFEASARWSALKSLEQDGHKHFIAEDIAFRCEGTS
jgi:hypothetical protein